MLYLILLDILVHSYRSHAVVLRTVVIVYCTDVVVNCTVAVVTIPVVSSVE